ncbi:hypothetical protein EJ05DRAFT_539646 [Pseudovirgaria hyperparasitica]|uniref:GPI anchored protein n=1 Tax=Pseudovirgaria hyperparasitica TaxID=470096 RepID=A0A6A6W1H4_9PEZI|nr:uncharacterized protein EJ05DRAFT_539646 [Pseudovirgaria hyperparasitica]KAF2756762.1 hypothetical protein EJ05DRAFT_539646 [Pseudovirgaria hyperparasitica]
MHASSIIFAFAAVAAAASSPAKQFSFNKRQVSQDIDPSILCGDDYVDCNNGWCCGSGETCGTIADLPTCDNGGDIAYPYNTAAAESALAIASSLLPSGILPSDLPGQVTDLVPSHLATLIPTGLASLTSLLPGTTNGADHSASHSASSSSPTNSEGAAAGLRAPGVSGAWGVAGIWATAVVGGMAWVLVR